MNATGIAMKLISLVFAGSIFLILFKRIKVLRKYGLLSVVYVLLLAILLATPTLLLLFDLKISDIGLLVIAQVFILAMGVLHVTLSPSALPWLKDQTFSMQLLYIFCILLIAYFFSDLSISLIVNPKLSLIWYLSLLWFVVPVLLNETVNQLLQVPPREFRKWLYPVNERVDDPGDDELDNPIVISFIFRKNDQSDELTTFRAKAPAGMRLGRLFYFFINDYNDRHPDSQISIRDKNGEAYGWVFLKVRNRFLGIKDALDPESPVYLNNIRENDVLICNRFELTEKS